EARDAVPLGQDPQDLIIGTMSTKRSCTFWRPRRGGEVPQQLIESFLIHVMSLPAPKVANVSGVATQCWPARLQGHDRVVDPDREEDGRALLAFPCQRGFHLLLPHWLVTDVLERTRSSLS